VAHANEAFHTATFADKVRAIPGGEHLEMCYACGTCVSTCMIQQKVEPLYNPRRLLRLVMIGMEQEAFESPTTWLCSECDLCYPACPQQIHISGVIGAIKQLAVEAGYTSPLVPARVDAAACFACGLCIEVCPYQAISRITEQVEIPDPLAQGRTLTLDKEHASVDPALCMSCGLCASACLASCITLDGYTDEQVDSQARAQDWVPGLPTPSGDGWSPRVLAFVCNWSVRAEADMAYLASPPGVQVVSVPCSGRITPTFLITALQKGIDGVLVVGCKPGECHYKEGNLVERARLTMTCNLLDLLGLEKERVRFAWLPTETRGALQALFEQMVADVRAVGPVAWRPELG
jgi:coenzyme F420-reducing hydrogenase delta subunit/heterodisulfide reductase subunit C